MARAMHHRRIGAGDDRPLLSMKPASMSQPLSADVREVLCSRPGQLQPTTWRCRESWTGRRPTDRGSLISAVEHVSGRRTARSGVRLSDDCESSSISLSNVDGPSSVRRHYTASQHLGRTLRESESNGVAYDSVRRIGGECAAVFRPPLLSNARQERHLCYYRHLRWLANRDRL